MDALVPVALPRASGCRSGSWHVRHQSLDSMLSVQYALFSCDACAANEGPGGDVVTLYLPCRRRWLLPPRSFARSEQLARISPVGAYRVTGFPAAFRVHSTILTEQKGHYDAGSYANADGNSQARERAHVPTLAPVQEHVTLKWHTRAHAARAYAVGEDAGSAGDPSLEILAFTFENFFIFHSGATSPDSVASRMAVTANR